MASLDWIKEKYIYVVVLVLLLTMLWVIYVFQAGQMDVEAAKVYLQALTAVATLALLYYSYYNVANKKDEDIAHLELAVRPIFIWELESIKGGAQLSYKAIKHPIYDFRAVLRMGGKELKLEERHLDVVEAHPGSDRKIDVTRFISEAASKEKSRLLELEFAYHSEVGGRYEFTFTKEILRKSTGFIFQHRKIVSAKYPWRKEVVTFED